jgi:ABC-type glutathione transport system ATPase component
MSPISPDALLVARDVAFAHPAGSDGRAFEVAIPELEIRAGEVLALCGPSGSGKSTALALLAGLIRPRSGRVRFRTDEGWIDLNACSPRAWRRLRRHFGFVHQDPRESLNDRRSVADIVADPLAIHGLPGGCVPSPCFAAWASRPSKPGERRTRCRAGSGNGSPSPGRSWPARG